jgi:hypothetical protein
MCNTETGNAENMMFADSTEVANRFFRNSACGWAASRRYMLAR